MRRLLVIASAAAITLATAPTGFAQLRGGAACAPGQTRCTMADPQRPPAAKPAASAGRQEARGGQAHRAPPRTGESGRTGQRFERAGSSRFNPPPRGQEYRVINEHLVLIDSSTLKIVSVLGLLNGLLK